MDTLYQWRRGTEDKKSTVLTGPDGRPMATARKRNWWSYIVDISLTDGRSFVLYRPSAWRSTVRIDDADGRELVSVTPHWWTGEALLRWKGSAYRWKRKSWWSGSRAWVDENGRDLCVFSVRWRWTGIDVDAKVERATPDDPALLAFGWYLLFVESMDAASAAT